LVNTKPPGFQPGTSTPFQLLASKPKKPIGRQHALVWRQLAKQTAEA
jgi:hypothetical protein